MIELFRRTRRRARVALLALASLAACDSGETGQPASARPRPAEVLYGELQERDTKPKVAGRDLTQLVEGNTVFALEMYANLAGANSGKNVAIGPYSISQAMAMLYAGARGVTATEMREALHFEIDPGRFHQTFNGLGLELLSRDGDITLRIANQLWAKTGFQPPNEFLDVMTRDYDAPLAVLDFAGDPEGARKRINQWVASATEEKIVELFPAGTIAGNTVLVLANAMYMDAPWKYQFDAKRTRSSAFTLLDGSKAMVDMMSYDEFLPSASGPGWQAVELPYRGDEVSMIAVVPDDFKAFEAALSPARLSEIISAIRDGGIHLSFPRFTFSFHASLVESFKALGAPSLFDGADLSGIGDGLKVAAIEHEAYIQVDEEGTKAAAATGVAIADSHGPTIDFDRPFFFFIIDRPTRSLLFLGRVLDPRQG
jgi:serpin B